EVPSGRRDASPGAVNGGDPLLNYLEALYLVNTTHAQSGLPRPRVVEAARSRRARRHREPWLKRPFQTTLADLARQAGAAAD
ncbi:MAG: hypothetical protein GY842_25140, partial [bacterium]|nr:hypothetical protein [bacterium]